MVYTWCADYPDPENFLEVLFYSTSSFNISAYSNPQVDAWLAEARADPDPAHRLDLFRQAETQILSDVAVIPWLYPTTERLVKPYVKGYVLPPMGAPVIHLVRLERP
jgi:ABC-type oligopeptide transport system substrate-binding subunit